MSTTSMPSSPMIPQDSALRVVKGSIASSLVATAGGSMYGIIKAQPASLYAFQSGANTFVFAFPFFALREYVISPLLHRDAETTSLHFKNVTASAISGTVVGGAMSAYFRGPQKFVSGSTTFALLCTTLQLLGNELRVLRIHMVAGRGFQSDVTIDSQVPLLPKKETPETAALPVDSPLPPKDLPAMLSSKEDSASSSSMLNRIGSYLSSLSPVKQISDEDYREQLKQRRQQVIERLNEVEKDIIEEEKTKKKPSG